MLVMEQYEQAGTSVTLKLDACWALDYGNTWNLDIMPAAAEPPPTPPAPAIPAAPPDKEELSFFEKNFGGRKEKKEEPKKDEKPADAAAKPAEKDEENKAAAPAPVKVKTKKADAAPVSGAPVDYDRMSKAIGDVVSTALDQRDKKKEQAEVVDLDDANRETLSMIERLEKKFPAIYKGRGERFLKSLTTADAYEAKWLADNPGEDFNEDSPAHESFFKSIGLQDIQPEHIKIVERDEIIEEAASRAEKRASEKFKPEIQRLQSEERQRKAAPIILANQVKAAQKFFNELGDTYKGVLDKDGNIVGEEINRIHTVDPVKAIAFQFVQKAEAEAKIEAQQFADEYYEEILPFETNLHGLVSKAVAFSDQDRGHVSVARFVDGLEAKIKAMPQAEQMWNGQQFATADEFESLSPHQKPGRWKLDEAHILKAHKAYAIERPLELEQVIKEKVAESVSKAKKAMEFEEAKLGKYAQARGYVKSQDGNASQRTTPESQKELVKTPDTPASPPGVIEPRMTFPAVQNPASNGSATKTFWSLFGGR